MATINQKEYLKKYLKIGKGTKHKKKKSKKDKNFSNSSRVQIIDDDLEANSLGNLHAEDPFAANEDAPQIVAIIDERPPSMRIDDKTKDNLWQPIGGGSNSDITSSSIVVAKNNEKNIKDIVIIDESPPRARIRRSSEEDASPPRKRRNCSADRSGAEKNGRRAESPIRLNDRNRSPPSPKHDGDASPPRRRRKKEKMSRWEDGTGDKMKKTLDGKTAGLQNAKDLVEETRRFKEREEMIFKSMSEQVSGEKATTIRRDRKTGKIRDLEEEESKKIEKRIAEEKNKEKYSKWGRGLVQVENRDRRIQEEIYEMSKPLARYADDVDLEKHLKQKERDGDPMLAYIRSKRKKANVEAGIPEKPQYQGEFMPNRYGIRPGHRWDGVDRSSGYEKKWFEVQNEKRAVQEDTYKWSTEDM